MAKGNCWNEYQSVNILAEESIRFYDKCKTITLFGYRVCISILECRCVRKVSIITIIHSYVAIIHEE